MFTRWWMNLVLPWLIPFNRPHGFRVVPLQGGGISVHIPYWRINRNHIRGVHACCLATAAEMCSGLSVLEHLDPRRYRMIMRSLTMNYHYQAKEPVVATCVLSRSEVAEHVLGPLGSQAAVDHTNTVELRDRSGNHLATGIITWQVKAWEKVRTKV